MKSINLVEALDASFSPSLVKQLSGKFGFPPKIFHFVLECAAPIFVTALIVSHIAQRSRKSDSILFDTVMSPEINENIVEQFSQLAGTTSGMKGLENIGQMSVARGLTIDPGALGDFVASAANVPEQSTYAMTGLIAAALFGILKRHLLDHHAASPQGLDKTLLEQWPMLDARVTDSLAQFLRFANIAALRRAVNEQLHSQPEDDGQRDTSSPNVAQEQTTQADRAAAFQTSPLHKMAPAPVRRWVRIIIAVLVLGICAAAVDSIWWLRMPSGKAIHGLNLSGGAATTAASTSASTHDAMSTTSVNTPNPAHAINPVTAPLPQSHFSFGVNRKGGVAVIATVASEADKKHLLDILTNLGAGHYTANVTVNPQIASVAWLPQVHALLPLMRMPRADMTLDGTNIELGGAAARGSKPNWAARVQTIFGPTYRVSRFDPAQAVAAATTAFRAALTASQQSGSCTDAGHVLSLQVIDFASGHAKVPASATRNLQAAAQLLKACAAKHQPVQLDIEAFTDNIGYEKANLKLSAKRAEAVREFLVQAGVPADSLTVHGFGIAQPVASETTERGRFENRRVEFVQAAGETERP